MVEIKNRDKYSQQVIENVEYIYNSYVLPAKNSGSSSVTISRSAIIIPETIHCLIDMGYLIVVVGTERVFIFWNT